MPELPEVETILQSLKPYLNGMIIQDVIVRKHQLRWPIPKNFKDKLKYKYIHALSRRGKYLIIYLNEGNIIIHFGMSGSLRILTHLIKPQPHDHVDIIFNNNLILRYTDPRRFGTILFTAGDPLEHTLLKSLGVEPLEKNFTTHYLFEKTKSRRLPIKSLIMNSKIVVGVGNIYATEALFLAGIHPLTPASSLNQLQCQKLVKAIKSILRCAIKKGGSTLKDFIQSDGKPGYFTQQLKVYGRAGLPCVNCHANLKLIIIGQRSTVFCSNCQR